jgi:hypothetical protein
MMIFSGNAYGADLWPERLVRPSDQQLRERILTTHMLKNEPLSTLAIVPGMDSNGQGNSDKAISGGAASDEATGAYDHYMKGTALRSMGRFNQAGHAFFSAIEQSRPGSRLWQLALRQYITVSPHMPDPQMPDISGVPLTSLDERTLLHLTGFLSDSGDQELASRIISGGKIKDPELRVLSTITSASHLALSLGWDISAKKVSRVRPDKTSPLTDLLFLTRGYHNLQAGRYQDAREAFLAVPPSSPYAPESLFGQAWSLIRQDDIQAAALRLEELVDLYNDSPVSREGALHLALCYRDLGLHDRAGTLLDRQVKHLREVRNWLTSLSENDLLRDKDLTTLLEQLLGGQGVDPDLLSRTPVFARYWLQEVSSDPYIVQTTALLEGAGIVSRKAYTLADRFEADHALVRKEVKRTDSDLAINRVRASRLEQIRRRLPVLKKDMRGSLQSSSLARFGSETSAALLTRIEGMIERLSVMDNSVQKAEGFSSLVSNLSDAVTTSPEEGQLNKVRQQAYEGLISSRSNLRFYRESLVGLQGQIWLALKNEAIRLEKRTSLRTTSARTRAGQALADSTKARMLLDERRKQLMDLEAALEAGQDGLTGASQEKAHLLSERIATMRARKLLQLASGMAQELEETEALTLYTAADIEISRMENTVQALQEAVE